MFLYFLPFIYLIIYTYSTFSNEIDTFPYKHHGLEIKLNISQIKTSFLHINIGILQDGKNNSLFKENLAWISFFFKLSCPNLRFW